LISNKDKINKYMRISHIWKDVIKIKTTCIINNYNYSAYITEAIDSVLKQTLKFDELIIIDDGSTDNSVEIIIAKITGCNYAKLIKKSNKGQLSCFNEAFKLAEGNLIFFLDADDLYEKDYHEKVLDFYKKHPECDFLFCGKTEFGRENRVALYNVTSCDLGYSLISTLYRKTWIGGATSTLAIKRSILTKILPLPFEDEWITRADDCLVFGASLAGARKFFLALPLVRYRVHQNNYFYGKNHFDDYYRYSRERAIIKLFSYLVKKNNLDGNLWRLIVLEFRTQTKPYFKNYKLYLKIIWDFNLPLKKKLQLTKKLTDSFLRKINSKRDE